MSAVILDTNIYIRATAIQVEDPESAYLNSSKHDRDSSPQQARGSLSPRQCRALICSHLFGGNKLLMPAQQADELLHVIDVMRRNQVLKPHNETLLKCLSQFAQNAAIGNRVPVLAPHLEQQYLVIKEALSIARLTEISGVPERQYRAHRFIEKNERFLLRSLPQPNIEILQRGQQPFVWNDFLLCHAAKRAGTIVATLDRDFDFLAEAFVRVTKYNPSKILEYYPGCMDVSEFRGAFEKKSQEKTPDI